MLVKLIGVGVHALLHRPLVQVVDAGLARLLPFEQGGLLPRHVLIDAHCAGSGAGAVMTAATNGAKIAASKGEAEMDDETAVIARAALTISLVALQELHAAGITPGSEIAEQIDRAALEVLTTVPPGSPHRAKVEAMLSQFAANYRAARDPQRIQTKPRWTSPPDGAA